MKVFVTGASGFIGYNIAARLKKEGHDVLCLVRKTSKPGALEGLGVKLVTGDVTDAVGLDAVFASSAPECVIHAAARVMGKKEEDFSDPNVTGTRNICELSLRYGVKRMVYISSIAVVNGNSDLPLVEDLPYKANTFYGLSKIEAEKIALSFRDKGLVTAILRPCIIYGEGEPRAMDRILSLAKRKLIPVPGIKGLSDRLQLGYVGNVVDAVILAMEKPEAVKGTFFVADKEVLTLRSAIEIVYDELGAGKPFVVPGWIVRAALVFGPCRRFFNRIFKDRMYDITRLEKVMGYTPRVSTEDGLRRTVKAWKKTK